MTTGEPEVALVGRARRGDREAFGQLVIRYYQPIVAMAYRLIGNTTAAEDVAQVTFLRAWSQLANLRDDAAFRAWLYRLAMRAGLDMLRRSPREEPLAETAPDPAPAPEAEALAGEQARQVRQAVLALPTHCRAALVLREFEGLSYGEIAEVLGIPIGTVMSRLAYARKLLRTSLVAPED